MSKIKDYIISEEQKKMEELDRRYREEQEVCEHCGKIDCMCYEEGLERERCPVEWVKNES